MKIVMIGTGNVATVLCKMLHAAGHSILQVYGRNKDSAEILAAACAAGPCCSWHDITQEAELYIIALADKIWSANEIGLQLRNQLVVHTAGAVSMQVLKNISTVYGVLYPFQTIRKEIDSLPEIPLLVDANTDAAKEKLLAIAKTISRQVSVAGDMQRMQYVLAEDYCKKQDLDFANLLPLIDETAKRLHHFSPRQVQTGPAARKDMNSIQQHLTLLQDEPALKDLYSMFTENILQYKW
jgi:predicted short-subunit dehydrogenase-like oxidoreductase (DUF2520 family)